MWGWATCRRVKGSAEWSPMLHPGQRAHGVGAEHGGRALPTSLVATVDFIFLVWDLGTRHQKSLRAAVTPPEWSHFRCREGKPVHAFPISMATWECPCHSFL